MSIIFYRDDNGYCLTECKFKDDETMVNSWKCSEFCKHFKGKGKFLFFKYVKCEGKR